MTSKYPIIVQEETRSPVAEAYRILRTNISYCKADGQLKTLMFTSSGSGEGKSLTIANMAVSLAMAGKRVIIVDCDFRNPMQQKIFKTGRRVGVTSILTDKGARIDDFISETDVKNLFLLASGPVPPNPSELLGSEKMNELIAYLRERFSYVIFDVPPVIAVTDACVLVSKLDGVVLVLDIKTICPQMAQKAKELILKARGHLLGVVLNRAEVEVDSQYYNYYTNQPKAVGK